MGLLQHSSLTIVTRWIGFVLEGTASILVARYVGPAGKGTLAVLGVIAGLTMQMGNVGLHAATTYFAARERETLPRIAWASLVLAPGIGLVLALGLGWAISFFPTLVPNIPALLIVATLLGIPFAFLQLFFQNILLGQQRIGAYNLLDVGGKAMALPMALVILLILGGGVQELVVTGVLVSVVMATIAVRLAFRGVSTPFVFDRLLLWRMLTYGLRSYVACLLAFLIILIWHMYGAHLNPEVFPFDSSIFTGKISVERLRHEHPLEWERLNARGEAGIPDGEVTEP